MELTLHIKKENTSNRSDEFSVLTCMSLRVCCLSKQTCWQYWVQARTNLLLLNKHGPPGVDITVSLQPNLNMHSALGPSHIQFAKQQSRWVFTSQRRADKTHHPLNVDMTKWARMCFGLPVCLCLISVDVVPRRLCDTSARLAAAKREACLAWVQS